MVRALVRLGVVLAAILLESPVHAIPYWFAWEGNAVPEKQGWTRSYNNAGDVRALNGGMMTLDGMSVPPGYDGYEIEYPGSIDPDAGETFVMQWRMRVAEIVGSPWDLTVAVFSDESWAVAFHYSMTQMRSSFEMLNLDISPFTLRDYELRSGDMRSYDLFVDGALAHSGAFVHVASISRVGWGDGFAFTRSTSEWDYVRVGVVPEAQPVVLLSVLGMVATSVRRAQRFAQSLARWAQNSQSLASVVPSPTRQRGPATRRAENGPSRRRHDALGIGVRSCENPLPQ